MAEVQGNGSGRAGAQEGVWKPGWEFLAWELLHFLGLHSTVLWGLERRWSMVRWTGAQRSTV